MIVTNSYELVWPTTKRCQFHYRNQMHWYTEDKWFPWDQSKEVIINLSKIHKVTNDNPTYIQY